MATVWVTEFAHAAASPHTGFLPAMKGPALDEQRFTFTTATPSNAFTGSTRFVRVTADAVCHLAFGDNPTATADSMRLPSGAVEYFGVEPLSKVSVYDGTS